MVGTFGSACSLAHDRQRMQLPVMDLRHRRSRTGDANRRMPGDRRADRQTRAVVRHVHKIEAERQAQLFAQEMPRGPDPGRRIVVLARIGFDEGDEILDRPRRQGRVNREHQRIGGRHCYGIEVLAGVIRDSVEESGIYHVVIRDEDDRVSVRCGLCGPAHRDIAARSGYVLDVELLAQTLGQF